MSKSTRWLMAVIPIITLFAFVAISGTADVPNTLNYQGTLTDNTGQIVTGSHQIMFGLYNVPSGGTAFWTETQTVQVTNGRFSVVLGKTTPLDTTKFSGTTYIGIAVDAGAEMAPRQQLTSVAYALKAGSIFNMPDTIPKGLIAMWSGAANQIPAGWALCDGQPKTAPDGSTVIPPNLQNKFILGAGNPYNVGTFGGSATKDLSHTHTTGDHTLTPNEMPAHNHNNGGYQYLLQYTGSNTNSSTDSSANEPDIKNKGAITSAGGGAAHSHGATSPAGSSTHDIMPPYYTLAFIMKL